MDPNAQNPGMPPVGLPPEPKEMGIGNSGPIGDPPTPPAPAKVASIGRIVHFNSDNGNPAHKVAAMITQVDPLESTKVGLVIFGANGLGFRLDVNYGQQSGEWCWPEMV